MKVLIDSRGYVTREDSAGIEMPEGVTGADSLRYKRVNNAWVDAFPDDIGDDFMESRDVLVRSWAIDDHKTNLAPLIKAEAARQIEALAWKIERATEVDATDGTTTLADVYAERAAVRAASNAHEDALDAITTQEALVAFHPANF